MEPKPYEIDTTGLLFRLYSVYGKGDTWDIERGRVNFCQYLARVGGGIITVIAFIILGAWAGLGLLQVFGSLALGLYFGYWDWLIPVLPNPYMSTLSFFGMAAMLALIIEFAICFVVGILYLEEQKKVFTKIGHGIGVVFDGTVSLAVDHLPLVIRTWYEAHKFQFCPMVELKKKENE